MGFFDIFKVFAATPKPVEPPKPFTINYDELTYEDDAWKGTFLPPFHEMRRLNFYISIGKKSVPQDLTDYANKIFQYIDVFIHKAHAYLEENEAIDKSTLNVDIHPTTLIFEENNSVFIYFSIINGPGAWVKIMENDPVEFECDERARV